MSKKLRLSLWSWALLSPLVLLTLFPFAVMLITALKPAQEVLRPTWIPSRLEWGNFITMWDATNFGTALFNSLSVAIVSTCISLAVSVPFAYAMVRFQFRGKGALRQFLLITQMLSPIVLVIGLFKLAASLGMIDNTNGIIIVYAAFGIAFSVWMLQSYFATIPRDIEEAAWLEGASRKRTLVQIMLPMAAPAIVVTALFSFVNAWNEFVIALTMLRRQETYTLPIQVFSLVAGRYSIEWHHVMAAALVSVIPVVVLFSWGQRYFVRGLGFGAVK